MTSTTVPMIRQITVDMCLKDMNASSKREYAALAGKQHCNPCTSNAQQPPQKILPFFPVSPVYFTYFMYCVASCGIIIILRILRKHLSRKNEFFIFSYYGIRQSYHPKHMLASEMPAEEVIRICKEVSTGSSLHCTALHTHCNALAHTAMRFIHTAMLFCSALSYTLHCTALSYTLQCSALLTALHTHCFACHTHCTAHCTALLCSALHTHCSAHCTALHCASYTLLCSALYLHRPEHLSWK